MSVLADKTKMKYSKDVIYSGNTHDLTTSILLFNKRWKIEWYLGVGISKTNTNEKKYPFLSSSFKNGCKTLSGKFPSKISSSLGIASFTKQME